MLGAAGLQADGAAAAGAAACRPPTWRRLGMRGWQGVGAWRHRIAPVFCRRLQLVRSASVNGPAARAEERGTERAAAAPRRRICALGGARKQCACRGAWGWLPGWPPPPAAAAAAQPRRSLPLHPLARAQARPGLLAAGSSHGDPHARPVLHARGAVGSGRRCQGPRPQPARGAALRRRRWVHPWPPPLPLPLPLLPLRCCPARGACQVPPPRSHS